MKEMEGEEERWDEEGEGEGGGEREGGKGGERREDVELVYIVIT